MRQSASAGRVSASPILDRWSVSPWFDYIIVGLIVGGHILITTYTHHGDYLRWIPQSQQITVYGTGATVLAVIGGFGAIAISVYLAAGGDRAKAVRARFGAELRRNWRAVLLGLGLSTAVCLAAQALDTTNDQFSTRYLFETAMLLASIRFFRLVWLFDSLIRVADRDLTDPQPDNPPQLSAAWQRR